MSSPRPRRGYIEPEDDGNPRDTGGWVDGGHSGATRNYSGGRPPGATGGRSGASQKGSGHPSQIGDEVDAEIGSPEGSLKKVSLLMASGTLVSRILGLVRTAMLTAVVGQSLAADAFGYANTLPNFFFNLISTGVLNAVLIPQITKAMQRKDRGKEFIDRLLTTALALCVTVAVAATVLSPILVRALSGLSGPAEHLAVLFAYICMPQIAFYGLYAVLGNVLNTRGRYAAYMWSPTLANIVQIGGMVIFLALWSQQRDPSLWTSAMVWTLAGSSTVGIAIQGLALIGPLRRTGFQYRPRFGLKGLGEVSRMAAWTISGLIFQQIGGMVRYWMMNSVRQMPGNEDISSIATQQNAFLVFMLPHSLVTVSILTALFPLLSRSWQQTKLRQVRTVITKGMQLPAVGVIPMSLLVVAVARPLVDVVFVGLNDREASDLAISLAIMSFGTFAYGLVTWQQRYYFASNNGRGYFTTEVLHTVVQAVFWVFGMLVVPGRYMVFVVSLGQTVSSMVVAVVFMAVASAELNGVNLSQTLKLWTKLTLAGSPALVASWVLATWTHHVLDGWIGAFMACCLGTAIFGILFWVMAKALHIHQVSAMVTPVLKKLGMLCP